MVNPISSAMPGQHSIVDLQMTRASDLRVEFGRRVTWNVARHEFGPSGNQPSMASAPAGVARGCNSDAWRARLP